MKKMKKLLLVTMLFAFAFAQAQTILPVKTYIYTYTGVATDTVGSGTTTWNKAIQLNKLDGLYYNAKVKVSDVVDGAACTVKLQGKIFSTDSYTDISTVTWTGAGTDTTILFTQNSNKVYYRYLNFLVTRTAGKLKVDYINLSLKR